MARCIMTVDDSTRVRQMIAFTLKNADYDIIEATDGIDALIKAKNTLVHMVLTDLNMPNMGGIELIRHLRADPAYRFTPIVMLTTESQDEKRQEGRIAGATGWIVKPLRPEQLLAVVRKVLG